MNFSSRTFRREPALAPLRRRPLTLSVLLLASACGRATDESELGVSGSTNWLECADDSDCGGLSQASCSGGYCVDPDGARISVTNPVGDPKDATPSSAPDGGAQAPLDGGTATASATPSMNEAPPVVSAATPSAGSSSGEFVTPGTCAAPLFEGDESPVYFASTEANYTLETNLDVQLQTVQADVPLTFDWSALTQDYLGRPLDPTQDAVKLTLSMRELTPAGLLQELNGAVPEGATLFLVDFPITAPQTSLDLLDPAYVSGTQLTPGQLMKFFNADPAAGYDPEKFTYSLTLQSSEGPGHVRALGLFKLDPTSSEDVVTLTNDSTELTYSVDLEGKPPLLLPLGDSAKALTVDWSGLSRPATRAFVVHYNATVPDIEAQFSRWDDLPAERWETEVRGAAKVRLHELVDVRGDAFPGIDDTGTWLFGLSHEEDLTGLPSYLTVLKSCAL